MIHPSVVAAVAPNFQLPENWLQLGFQLFMSYMAMLIKTNISDLRVEMEKNRKIDADAMQKWVRDELSVLQLGRSKQNMSG